MKIVKFLFLIGFILFFSNNINANANVNLDSLKNLLDTPRADFEKLGTLHELVQYYNEVNFQIAKTYATQAILIAKNITYEKSTPQAFIDLANAHFNLSEYADALAVANRGLIHAEKLNLAELIAELYAIKGQSLYKLNKKEEAKVLFQKSVDISESNTYDKGLTLGLKGMGDLVYHAGDFDEAKTFYHRSFESAERSENLSLIALAYNDLGVIYDLSGEYEVGMDYYLKGARIAEDNGLLARSGKLIGNTASLYYIMKEHDKAIEYARKAVALYQEVGDRKGEGKSTTTIGNVYFRKGKYQEALPLFQKALEISIRNKDKRGQSFAYTNLGKTIVELGDLDKGREYYRRSLKLREELGFKFGVLGISRRLARSYLSTKEYDQAIVYAEKALRLSKEVNSVNEITPSHGVLALIYKEMGDYNKAFYYQKQYSIYKDTLYNEKKIKELTEIQTLYETEKKEKTILEQDNDILELEKNNTLITTQRNSIMAGSMALGLLSLFGFQWNKVRKERNDKKEFAEALIFTQEEERKRLARDLHDGVGQSLLLIKKQMERTGQTVQENQNLITQTLEEVRSISQDLHPFQLEKFGLSTAIENIIKKVEDSTDLFITKEIENIDKILSPMAEINLFRTVQEAISNIVKHAEASAAKISIAVIDDRVVIAIRDNGKGIKTEDSALMKRGLGLRTMNERISGIGGSLNIEDNKPNGTHVEIRVPIVS